MTENVGRTINHMECVRRETYLRRKMEHPEKGQ